MKSFFQLFKPAPHTEPIQDPAVVANTYNYWRIRVFYSIFFGYAFYYFTRKSFIFAMPTMMTELGYTKSELGLLSSVFAISYGLSKFASGLIADRSNPRYFVSFGLIMTGIANILFGSFSTLAFFVLFWGLNGYFQGFGWPGCTRLLTHWYSQSERGRWWSVFSTSQNIGGALIPLIVAACAANYGWRYAMYVPGVLSIVMGFILMNRLVDTPQSLGLPTVEAFRNDFVTVDQKQHKERELSVREILFEHILSNKFLWILAISYFFVYVIRTAMNEWTVLYLIEKKSYSMVAAAGTVVWFEIGGFFGSLTAGWVSDTIFRGKRGPVNALFSLLVSIVVGLFWIFQDMPCVFDGLFLFAIGFLIFGPQMLIGVAAAELSHKKAAATATGFIGWIAYAGAAFAGYPLGWITQTLGWSGYFITLIICGSCATFLLIPLWSVVSSKERIIFEEKQVLQAR